MHHRSRCSLQIPKCRLLQDHRSDLITESHHGSKQALVKKENEPITPFISKIRSLLARGVSSILVMGGSGDYFGVSDTVLRMDSYEASDVTAEALAIDRRFGSAPTLADNTNHYGTVAIRTPVTIYPGSPSGD